MSDIRTAPLAFEHNGIRPAPGKPAIVLVHGAGGQARDWPVAWRSLRGFARIPGKRPSDQAGDFNIRPVFAVDLPGHGRSPAPGLDSVGAYADSVADFIDRQRLSDVVVVGHSMGAAIALDLAARRLPGLAGIVTIGGAAKLDVSDAILDGLENQFEATVDAIVRYSWAKQASPFFKDLARERMRAAGQETVHGDFLACSRYDLIDRLGEIAVPALVLASSADRMVSLDASRAVHEGLAGSLLVTLDDCGHFLHVERTADCAAAISEFLRRLD